jgi:hypothetical protein
VLDLLYHGHSLALSQLAGTAINARSLARRIMRSLADVRNFFRSRDPVVSSVKLRVASALNVFVAIRGLEALLDRTTAIVMCKGYETLVTQDSSALDHRENNNILAVVHVKDMGSYDRLTKIQTNHLIHRGMLDRAISNHLADEVAKQLLKKARMGAQGPKARGKI